MENMNFYDKWREPPEEALKDFNNGTFSGTDINSMWRIKMLTEEFGPVGIGWYPQIVRTWSEKAADDEVLAFAEINLYIRDGDKWSAPIPGLGGNKQTAYIKSKEYLKNSDECYKMAFTDALGSACKLLGMGANVYWESDRSKYTEKTLTLGEARKEQLRTLQKSSGISGQDLKTLALKNNCLDLEEATETDFLRLVEALKKWKSSQEE